MRETVTARHRVALAGLVTDAITNRVFADAEVVIGSEPGQAPPAFQRWLGIYAKQFGAAWKGMTQRPDRTRSRADGLFYFLDLQDGEYQLTISAPQLGKRYGAVTQRAKVKLGADEAYKLDWLNVSLPPTTIAGCISSKRTNIGFAQVRVQGSGESAYSDDAGLYTIAGIEPGNRTLLVSAQGYKPTTQPVTIAKPGDVQKADVTLNLLHSAG